MTSGDRGAPHWVGSLTLTSSLLQLQLWVAPDIIDIDEPQLILMSVNLKLSLSPFMIISGFHIS